MVNAPGDIDLRIQRNFLLKFFAIGLLLIAATCDAVPSHSKAQHFDASQAWREFDELMTSKYGYLNRQGVDGAAILGYFAPLAMHTQSKAQFARLLKVVIRNFADPHLDITPREKTDYSVVPTGTDLYGEFTDGKFTIVDVRANGDAAQQGIAPGTIVETIEGQAPHKVIERLLGRPIAMLSPLQVTYGFNVALAGVRYHRRHIKLTVDNGTISYALQATYDQANVLDRLPAVEHEQRGNLGIIRVNNSLGRMETIAAFRNALKDLIDTQVLVIDLRNTPSGGNTTIARGIMGHFVQHDMPYQIHVVPEEERKFGVPRKFVEYVLPVEPFYAGHVFVIGGHWTGSMGEGLMIGFDALSIKTVGSTLGHLLGATFNEKLPTSGLEFSLGEEQLFHVNSTPRESFRPAIFVSPCESRSARDAAMDAVIHDANAMGVSLQ